jgi:hypothetical protein
MSELEGPSVELARIKRVADMLCSGHARLRDMYLRRATTLDLSILILTGWVSALVFVDPQIDATLTPFGLKPQLWTGLLALTAFFLAIVQLKTDWKGRADAHRRSLDVYADVKREAGRILAIDTIEERAYAAVIERYNMASAVGIPMPEHEFLKQKRHHEVKVAISRMLDTRPGASVILLRTRLWLRDNLKKLDNG